VKKAQLIVHTFWLLLISSCASPLSTPTPADSTILPKPTITLIPQSEPFPTAVKPDWLNVPYVPEGSSLQRLDVYLPANGYAVVSTDYRLTPRYSYPAQVEDVFCAMAWVHANHATYGLDNERIFVMGDSAGGYLAAMLGTIDTPSAYLENCPHTPPASDWIQGVVVFYGFYDFTSIDGYPRKEVVGYLQPFWGAEYSEIPPETLAEMSPIS
jgi:hypothetical protein